MANTECSTVELAFWLIVSICLLVLLVVGFRQLFRGGGPPLGATAERSCARKSRKPKSVIVAENPAGSSPPSAPVNLHKLKDAMHQRPYPLLDRRSKTDLTGMQSIRPAANGRHTDPFISQTTDLRAM